jgi:hypothetical protein
VKARDGGNAPRAWGEWCVACWCSVLLGLAPVVALVVVPVVVAPVVVVLCESRRLEWLPTKAWTFVNDTIVGSITTKIQKSLAILVVDRDIIMATINDDDTTSVQCCVTGRLILGCSRKIENGKR